MSKCDLLFTTLIFWIKYIKMRTKHEPPIDTWVNCIIRLLSFWTQIVLLLASTVHIEHSNTFLVGFTFICSFFKRFKPFIFIMNALCITNLFEITICNIGTYWSLSFSHQLESLSYLMAAKTVVWFYVIPVNNGPEGCWQQDALGWNCLKGTSVVFLQLFGLQTKLP